MDIQFNLNTESVQQVTTSPAVCVESAASLREVMSALQRDASGSALVCHAGKLVGIFTERDALRLMAADADWDAAIETVMTRQPVTVSAEDTVSAAIQRMSRGRYRRLPVVDSENRPLGLLKASAIMHYLVEHFPTTVYNQPPVTQVAMQDREGA